ncbi:hypothetical protein [Tolypothrix sp. VBCCA 56010]|uniref:hypothetical protein n=1 Tax=Tolypothrix sp. VBCCA 56010 TaxID=3137731 RepID=UPI003D7CA013
MERVRGQGGQGGQKRRAWGQGVRERIITNALRTAGAEGVRDLCTALPMADTLLKSGIALTVQVSSPMR